MSREKIFSRITVLLSYFFPFLPSSIFDNHLTLTSQILGGTCFARKNVEFHTICQNSSEGIFSIMFLVSELFKAINNLFHLLLKFPEFNPLTNEMAWREGYLIIISQTSQLFLLISRGYSPEVLIIKVLSHYFPQLVQTPQKCIL